MKKRTKIFYCNVLLLLLVLLLVGCADNTNEESEIDPSEENSTLESEEETDETAENEEGHESEPATGSEESTNEDPANNTYEDDNASGSEEDNPLSEYASEEIEYARVWLQLGVMKDVDELNVHQIPAGTPLNPDDETSAAYPEDVIQQIGRAHV